MPKGKRTAPETLAEKADKLFTLRTHRLSIQQQADEIEKAEVALRKEIIETLEKSDSMTGVSGKLVRVSLAPKTVPQVEDWDEFYTYVKRHNAFDLLQRRLSDVAVRLRWQDNRTIPGVGSVLVQSLSINKL